MMRIGSVLLVSELYVSLQSTVFDDSDVDCDIVTGSQGQVEQETNESQTNPTGLQSVLSIPEEVNSDLLQEIALKINICKGCRTTELLIRTKGGHILKSGSDRREQALWVYQKYGDQFGS